MRFKEEIMTLVIMFVIAVCILMPRSVATAFKAIKRLDREIEDEYNNKNRLN